jgi:hypothetical protein
MSNAGGTTTKDPKRRGRARRAALVVGAVATGLLVPSITGGQPAAAAPLTPFGDCDELDAWFTEQALELVGPWGLDGGGVVAGSGSWWTRLLGGGDVTVASGAAEAASDSATGTNVQEAGIDEPDLVKTDGRRVVVVSNETLHVLEATGDTLRPLGELRLGGQYPAELLLLGDRALVVGQRGGASGPADLPLVGGPDVGRAMPVPGVLPVPGGRATTTLTVVDLSDPGHPRSVRTEEVDGGYLSARAAGGAVRVVLSTSPVLPFVQPQAGPGGDVDLDAATEANRAVVEQATAEQWLPHSVVRDGDGREVGRAPLVDCASVAHPQEPAGLGLVTVLTLDAGDVPQREVPPTDDLATTDTVAVAADGDLVYASADRLYVATTRGGWRTVAGPSDGLTTQLHGFDTTQPEQARYVASGSVPGWLLGRWAMSARDGALRVATTVEGGPAGTESVVTVLAEQGDALVPVGSVGGLGAGEQIRAVRWFDDLAVVVTFRQTDPLYTVDLADPAAPRVAGELKIPGYSAYLHPLGEGLLLGVGQDATETGQVLGAQVSTFDLRDLGAPTRLDTVSYRDTQTDVEADSRAFTYLPDRRLALVPVGGPRGSSLVAVEVRPDGSLTEAGAWSPGAGSDWVRRAVPLDGDRLAVVSETAPAGRVVTLLRTADLTEMDEVRLGY